VAKELLAYKCRLGDSLQCSILTPYPGTPLNREGAEKGWCSVAPESYSSYDMDSQILKGDVDLPAWCGRMWKLHLAPSYVFGSVTSIRKWDELVMGVRGAMSLIGHIDDYGR
jgi:hypothetical protein